MAQFRATIEGSRGMASRLGTKKSGLDVRINGWNDGLRVTAYFDEETGKDVFEVFRTGGSNDSHDKTPIMVRIKDREETVFPRY